MINGIVIKIEVGKNNIYFIVLVDLFKDKNKVIIVCKIVFVIGFRDDFFDILGL